jgi:hypothetical protein
MIDLHLSFEEALVYVRLCAPINPSFCRQLKNIAHE